MARMVARDLHHGQNWPSIQVYPSNDISVTNAVWTKVWDQASGLTSMTKAITPQPARFVKVSSPSGTWNALCEFQVFAAPSSMGLCWV
jgi:hypothetical protein